jgi:hypothetical protein
MRMPHVRFTARSMSAVAGVVAVVLFAIWSGQQLRQRWDACQAGAERHEKLAQECLREAKLYEARARSGASLITLLGIPADTYSGPSMFSSPEFLAASDRADAAMKREKAARHLRLSKQYRWSFLNPFSEPTNDYSVSGGRYW